MKKRIFIVCMLFCGVVTAFGQITDVEKTLTTASTDTVSGWKFGTIVGINFSQTELVNWAAGGQSSLAFNGIFSASANYLKNKNSWENTLDIGYGLLRQGKKDDAEWMKTDDKIDFSSKYGRQAFAKFYYAALVNFKTQFTAGYNYPNRTDKISNFFAPAYLTGALGLSYQPIPYFSAFFAPATGRMTIVNDGTLSESFGLDAGKTTKTEFGGYVRVNFSRNDFKTEWLKNVAFTTKLDLFTNYLENPQNIDVSWETLIAFKVNKYISINLNTHLLYDADIKLKKEDGTLENKAKVQFKEILGIGFSCKL